MVRQVLMRPRSPGPRSTCFSFGRLAASDKKKLKVGAALAASRLAWRGCVGRICTGLPPRYIAAAAPLQPPQLPPTCSFLLRPRSLLTRPFVLEAFCRLPSPLFHLTRLPARLKTRPLASRPDLRLNLLHPHFSLAGPNHTLPESSQIFQH